jgi:hypothetical protein
MALPQNHPEFKYADRDDVTVDRGQVVCEISETELAEFEQHCREFPNISFNAVDQTPRREEPRQALDESASDEIDLQDF